MKRVFMSLVLFCSFAGHSQRSLTVHFDFDKHILREDARLQLDSFIQSVKQNNTAVGSIRLNGYCDARGSDKYNNTLSDQRVAAVKKYLIQNGVASLHIEEETGHGKKDPLNENSTEEERQQNRRVEISFIQVETTSVPGPARLKDKIADSATTVGSNIVLQNINFYGGSHQLLPESGPTLRELLAAMRAYPRLVIRIEGHICCQSHANDGLDGETGIYNLSEARAQAVRNVLVENNIDSNRVLYKGFGHSAPIYPYPEKTEEERIQNRRVEIKIINK